MDVNYIAVFAAAVVSMIVGSIWYMPKVLGNKWMVLAGVKPDKSKKMTSGYILNFIASLVLAYVLHMVISAFVGAGMVDAGRMGGAMTAFWVWLGFFVPLTFGRIIWEMKSYTLWMINAGYWLITLLLMGCVLGRWG